MFDHRPKPLASLAGSHAEAPSKVGELVWARWTLWLIRFFPLLKGFKVAFIGSFSGVYSRFVGLYGGFMGF